MSRNFFKHFVLGNNNNTANGSYNGGGRDGWGGRDSWGANGDSWGDDWDAGNSNRGRDSWNGGVKRDNTRDSDARSGGRERERSDRGREDRG